MRSNTLLISLLTSASISAVLAAPIPVIVLESWDDQPLVDGNGHLYNRPYTPSSTAEPASVLANPRPLSTTYLMGLSKSDAGRISLEKAVPVRIELVPDSEQYVVTDPSKEASTSEAATTTKQAFAQLLKEELTPTEEETEAETETATHWDPTYGLDGMEISFRTLEQVEIPCHYVKVRREHNDMMVISLVAVFLFVIITVELLDSTRSEYEDLEEALTPGDIRLEDNNTSKNLEKQPLSIQASADEAAHRHQ